jgi:hypothetical protein
MTLFTMYFQLVSIVFTLDLYQFQADAC